MGEDIKSDLAGIAITHPFFAEMVTNALNYIEELEKRNRVIKGANEYWAERCYEISNNSIPKSKVKEVLDKNCVTFFEGDTDFPDDASRIIAKYIKAEVLQDLLREE